MFQDMFMYFYVNVSIYVYVNVSINFYVNVLLMLKHEFYITRSQRVLAFSYKFSM